jgi:hypothetical protein
MTRKPASPKKRPRKTPLERAQDAVRTQIKKIDRLLAKHRKLQRQEPKRSK